MSALVRYSIPRLYYLVTLAFILLDYCGGISVRVAVLDNMPVYKNLYQGRERLFLFTVVNDDGVPRPFGLDLDDPEVLFFTHRDVARLAAGGPAAIP